LTTYVVTFHPLCEHAWGRAAIRHYGFHLFEDGSCRKEPDFLSRYPSITSLCRGRVLVPQLKPGDEVMYMSVKKKWDSEPSTHWRLVALLRVVKACASHEIAAAWYRAKGLPVPSNCLLRGSKPLPLKQTGGVPPKVSKVHPRWRHLREWDAGYRTRVQAVSKFVITKPLHVFLRRSPRMTNEMWEQALGRRPVTRGVQKMSRQEARAAFRLAVGREARP